MGGNALVQIREKDNFSVKGKGGKGLHRSMVT